MSIYGTDYLVLPKLSPFHFVKRQNGLDEFFTDSISDLEQTVVFKQKHNATDPLTFQMKVLTSHLKTATDYYAQLIDDDEVVYATFNSEVLYTDSDGWSYIHFNKTLQANTMAVFPDGTYVIQVVFTLSDDSTDDYLSEPIEIKQSHENTILLGYRHSENDFDMIHQKKLIDYKTDIDAGTTTPQSLIVAAPVYRMRVEGGLWSKDEAPASDDVAYVDETRSTKMLSSTPFNKYLFSFGNNDGLPNWLIDKINRVFSCEFVKIDRTFYTKSDGASFAQLHFTERYPMGAWSLEVVPYENDYSKTYKALMTDDGVGNQVISAGLVVANTITPTPTFEAVLNPVDVATALDALNGEVIQTTILDKISEASDSKADIRTSILAKGGTLPTTTPLSGYSTVIDSLATGDATWTLKDTAGATLDTGTIAAGGSDDIEAPDATANVTRDGVAYSSTDIKSGSSATIDVTSAASGGTTAPLSRTGQTVTYRTGDDQVGAGADFFTLDANNHFGNLQRFTSTIGGYYDQAAAGYKDVNGSASDFATEFANGIMIDWQTYNQVTGGINMYYVDTTNRTWENFIDWALALTQGGFSDWIGINANQATSLINYSFNAFYSWYPFFNMTGATGSYHTSTTIAHNTAYTWGVQVGVYPLTFYQKGASTAQCIAARVGNISEL
jgi:hypothetical protein